MKNLKKVIALIAVLALTLSTVALGATYTDVAEDSAYSVAVESLSKLGIVTGYEDGTYGAEKAVTRAEMAALIARIQGYEETAKANAATVFTDVPTDHWASGYVALASSMGIVNGYGDGTFGPDDSVKYEQAVTMIMRTLGYETFAVANGGYPTGYLAAAQRYGVTKAVSNAVSGTDANRGTIAQLLYNGIDTPIMAQSKWGTNGDIEYNIYDGTGDLDYKTLMSENLGVVKIKGVVTANVATNIKSSDHPIDTSKDEEVTVHILDVYDTNNSDFSSYVDYSVRELEGLNLTETFLAGDSEIGDYLGRRVILYAVEEDDDYVVISCTKDTTSNSEVSFTLDQFDSKVTTNGKTKLEYFKNATDSDTTSLTIDKNAVVIYNNVGGKDVSDVFGEGKTVYADCPYGGKVTLIDNNSTNGYDVIFVEVGVSGVVDEVNAAGDKVTFKENIAFVGGTSINKLEIDEDAEDKIVVIKKDGEAINFSDLKEWDVVTVVAENKSSDYIEAEVISAPVVGTVSSKKSSDTSDTKYAYKIEGSFYDVAPNAYKAANLAIGDGGTFYVDKYGKIVAFDEDATLVGGSAGNYAYVIETDIDSTFGSNYGQFRLLTANGTDIYDVVDDNLKVNDKSVENGVYDKDTKKYTEGSFLAGIAAYKDTLIRYTVNSSGEINKIWKAGSEKFTADGTPGTDKWDVDNLNLGGNVDEDAVVFLLAKNGGKVDKDESIVGTIADLEDGESYSYERYVDEKGDDCNILVITSGFSNVGGSSSVAVITDVSVAENDSMDDVLVLSYYKDGELVEDVMTNNTVYGNVNNNLSEGDIVKIKVSSEGVITSLSIYVDFDDPIRAKNGAISADAYSTVGDANGEQYVYGYATNYTKSSKTVTIDGNSYKMSNAENIYVIDASLKTGKVDVGSAGDFVYDKDLLGNYDLYADYIFARKYENSVKDIVIIKNIIDYDTTEKNVAYLEAKIADANAAIAAAEADKAAAEADKTAAEAAKTAAVADIATAEATITAKTAIMTAKQNDYDLFVADPVANASSQAGHDEYVAAEADKTAAEADKTAAVAAKNAAETAIAEANAAIAAAEAAKADAEAEKAELQEALDAIED